MKDDRQLKQLLFGEIDGVGFIGRPNMQWIDCINEDLKTSNISHHPRDFALDRDKWKSFMEGEGMDLAVIQWMTKNRERRKERMVRQGIVPVQCYIVENMNFDEGEGIIRELRLRKIEQEVSVKNIELEKIGSRRISEEKSNGKESEYCNGKSENELRK